MRIHVAVYSMFLATAGAQGCKNDERLRDELPKTVEIVALGARHAFDNNWEVLLRVRNDGDEPFRLEDLTADSAQLKLKDNSRITLHRISVGKAKPLVVSGHTSKNASLLFTTGKASPTALFLRGRKIPISVL